MLYSLKMPCREGWFFLSQRWLKIRWILALTLLLVLLPQVCFAEDYSAKPNKYPDEYDSDHPERLDADMLYATSAVAVDVASGRVLFSKEADRRIYPASTTKVMTAILALENLDLDQTVTVSKNVMVGESSIYLEEGESLTVRDLMYGLLLKSGNDAGVALAEAVAGSVDAFADMMNAKAEELGCTNTHFTTPHGLPDPNHYTTAEDYYKVFMEAIKNETFLEIIQTPSFTIHATRPDGTVRTYAIENGNRMLPGTDDEFSYAYMIGGKTGFTNAAQSAFVSLSEKDGMKVVTVVFGSTTEGKWIDTRHLADYVFSAYSILPFSQIYSEHAFTAQVSGAQDPQNATLTLALANPEDPQIQNLLCTSTEADDIAANFSQYASVTYTTDTLTAPIQEGEVVGQLHFQYEGMDEIVLDLAAANTVAAVIEEAPVATPIDSSVSDGGVTVVTTDIARQGWSPLYLLVIIPAVLFFILVVWLIAEVRRARRAKREMERARRNEEVKRRRAQLEYQHLQSNPLPRSQWSNAPQQAPRPRYGAPGQPQRPSRPSQSTYYHPSHRER